VVAVDADESGDLIVRLGPNPPEDVNQRAKSIVDQVTRDDD
jgi:hypothetical protein